LETVYVETSIPSYLVARPSRNIIAAARQQLTLEWWETQREQYDLCISNAVIAEAAQGDAVRAAERLAVVQSIKSLDITPQCIMLAQTLLSGTSLPERAKDDALHVAVASVHGIDFLLTWNCRHLANAHLIPKLRMLTESEGFHFPQICTPEELMGE
jgi:predicted nucleic acid-binding protein